MNKTDLQNKCKKLLIESKALLIKQLENVIVPVESYCGDEMDIHSGVLENQRHLDKLKRAAIQLRKTDRALLKIRENSFGICETCIEDIEPSRLFNTPFVDLCLSCKEIEEQGAHSFGRNSRLLA